MSGTDDGHKVPYWGTCDWNDIVSALREINFDGPFNFEIPNTIRPLPLGIRDEFIRYCYKLGEFMIRSIGA